MCIDKGMQHAQHNVEFTVHVPQHRRGDGWTTFPKHSGAEHNKLALGASEGGRGPNHNNQIDREVCDPRAEPKEFPNINLHGPWPLEAAQNNPPPPTSCKHGPSWHPPPRHIRENSRHHTSDKPAGGPRNTQIVANTARARSSLALHYKPSTQHGMLKYG